MQLLDWLKDGLLSHQAHYRHTRDRYPVKDDREERADPSGPHHFGRRAHCPDPNASYGFGGDPGSRMVTPHQR